MSSQDAPPLMRQLSAVEKNALKVALEKVKGVRAKVVAEGLTPITFFVGISNIVVSSYLFGRSPEHFWLVYCFQALATQIVRMVMALRDKSYLYLLDFCWICNLFFSIKATFLLLEAISPDYLHPMFHPFSITGAGQSHTLGVAAFVIACGPLGSSVIAFSNAMVLHSVLHYTAAFIHLFPPLTVWTLRWHAEDVDRAWPGVFSSYRLEHLTWLQVLTPACSAYFVWWVCFTTWMLLHGRHQSKAGTGRDTVYHATLRTNTAFAGVLGLKDIKDAPKVKYVIRYMLAHAVAVNISFANALGCYYSKSYHSFFCALILATALWFGSVKYNKIMTRHYVRSLEALIDERESAKKAE